MSRSSSTDSVRPATPRRVSNDGDNRRDADASDVDSSIKISGSTSSSSIKISTISSSSSTSTQENVKHVQLAAAKLLADDDEIPADVTAAFEKYARMTEEDGMRDLAAKAGLESEEDVEKFVGLLQDVLAQAHELNKKIVDPTLGETARIDDLRAVVEAKKAEAPTNVSIGAQAWNGSKAGFLSAVTGFAMVTLLGKICTYAGVAQPYQVLNAGGLIILMCGELLSGKYRSQGAGYAPVDLIAYQQFSTCVSKLSELRQEEKGAGRTRRGQIKEEGDKIRVQIQNICVGLIKQEFGQVIKMKGPRENADVNSRVPGLTYLIRSGVTCQVDPEEIRVGGSDADDDSDNAGVGNDDDAVVDESSSFEFCLADGDQVFTVDTRDKLTNSSFIVTWSDGKRTDLCKEPVPLRYRKAFSEMADALVGAARWRSFICNDVPLTWLNMMYMGVGPLNAYLQSVMTGATLAATDTVQAVGITVLAAVSASLTANFFGSLWSGSSPKPGAYSPEKEAKYDLLEFRRATLKVRAQALDDMRKQISRDIRNLEDRVNASDLETDSIQDDVELAGRKLELHDKLEAHRQALQELKDLCKLCVKESDAIANHQLAVAGKLKLTAVGWKDQMKAHFTDNFVQFAAKCITYTAPFVIYTQIFVPGVAPLRPGPVNTTFVDEAGVAHNQTAPASWEAWEPFAQANMAYGWVIGAPYMVRNVLFTRGLEYAGRTAIGGAKAAYRNLTAGNQ